MRIRIVLVDDHDTFRKGLNLLLTQHREYVIVGEARSSRAAVRLTSSLSPDIIITEISTARVDGIEATRRICQSKGDRKSKVIAYSASVDQVLIHRMLAAGASAYVSKHWSFHSLCRAVNMIHANKPYKMPASSRMPTDSEPCIPDSRPLSAREREALALLASGNCSKDIAKSLCVSIKTVEYYRHNLRKKLMRDSVADLTRYAIQEGIVSIKI